MFDLLYSFESQIIEHHFITLHLRIIRLFVRLFILIMTFLHNLIHYLIQ